VKGGAGDERGREEMASMSHAHCPAARMRSNEGDKNGGDSGSGAPWWQQGQGDGNWAHDGRWPRWAMAFEWGLDEESQVSAGMRVKFVAGMRKKSTNVEIKISKIDPTLINYGNICGDRRNQDEQLSSFI
jgi:hypothetical protein